MRAAWMRSFGLLVMLSATVLAQSRVGVWKNFTDMKTVYGVAIAGSSLYAATSGGLFVYDTAAKGLMQYTNSEGLSSNDLRAVTVDAGGRIWVGASDGSLNVLEPGSTAWKTLNAVKESGRSNPAITAFFQHGDSLFIVSNFGVSAFVLSRWEFADTYASFGFASQPLVTSVVTKGNQIWIGTNLGLVTASLSFPNLSAPTAWSQISSASITSLTVWSDSIIAGTTNGCLFGTVNSLQPIPAFAGKNIVDIQGMGPSLFVLSGNSGSYRVESIATFAGSPTLVAMSDSLSASTLAISSDGQRMAVGTLSRGIGWWTGGTWQLIAPNGPNSNLFTSLVVDPNGVLWAATGYSGRGHGFYRYNPALPFGQQWKTFSVADMPVMASDDYYKVSAGAKGHIWVSSWGSGIVEVVADTIGRRLYASSIPNLVGADASSQAYVVAGGAAADVDGTMWIPVHTTLTEHQLAHLTGDSTAAYYRNQYNINNALFHNILVDQNGTKWLGNSEPAWKSSQGLYYFNEKTLMPGAEATGGWGWLSTADALPNNSVLSLAIDLQGDLWIGTDLGAVMVTDTRYPKTQKSPVFVLREQSIQTIAVDAVNNKWVGTKQGVFVVSSDGSQLLNQYTKLSTGGMLIDDDVRSIAIDHRRGMVYIGTERGLSTLSIDAVQTQQAYTVLAIAPNPYVIPASEPVEIRNMVGNSTVKILSVSGHLITEFKAQGGGRAFWDGKTNRGDWVGSGVYFVVAYADNGNEAATGKIAVVRK